MCHCKTKRICKYVEYKNDSENVNSSIVVYLKDDNEFLLETNTRAVYTSRSQHTYVTYDTDK